MLAVEHVRLKETVYLKSVMFEFAHVRVPLYEAHVTAILFLWIIKIHPHNWITFFPLILLPFIKFIPDYMVYWRLLSLKKYFILKLAKETSHIIFLNCTRGIHSLISHFHQTTITTTTKSQANFRLLFHSNFPSLHMSAAGVLHNNLKQSWHT